MERTRRALVAGVALAVGVLLATSGGCGTQKNGQDFGGVTDDASAAAQDDGSSVAFGQGNPTNGGFSAGPCSGLGCKVDNNCSNGKQTTITGKVYDPAGKNPLYNIVVFVPNDPRQAAADHARARTPATLRTPIGDYVALTQTAADGSFTLTDVPRARTFRSCVQVGKWRRMITVANVADCADDPRPRQRQRPGTPPAKPQGGRHAADGPAHGRARRPRMLPEPHGHRRRRVLRARTRGGRLDIYQGLGNALGGGPANGRASRTERPATARPRAARSGRARRASRRTTSCSSPARATPTSGRARRRRHQLRRHGDQRHARRASRRCTTG